MKTEQGFTLIELLVAVAIIGLLAAIAVPTYAEYKIRSFNARALSDLQNVLTSEEAYYVSNETYFDCGTNLGVLCEGNLPGIDELSLGVILQVQAVTSPFVPTSLGGGESEPRLVGASCHVEGDSFYQYDSSSPDSPSIIQRMLDGGTTCTDSVAVPPEGVVS